MSTRSLLSLGARVLRTPVAGAAARVARPLRAMQVAPLSFAAPLRSAPKIVTPPTAKLSTEPQKNNEEYTELTRDFIDPSAFYQALQNIGIKFFCGVPDSLLKDFCAYVTANSKPGTHIITANEGNAIALGAGYYLATKQFPLIYLQNSGLGNAVNPLMSLTHPDIYSIPMLILVGWRGEPGKRDEPQHLVQGEVTPSMLASMGIPFQVMPDYIEGAEKTLQTALKYMQTSQGPYVLLVKRQTFTPFSLGKSQPRHVLRREGALEVLLPEFTDRDVVVGTTGMLSRELFEMRASLKQGHEKDFLTVGSMGHASTIALGVAMHKPRRRVIVLDGDGAALMQMGAMATIGAYRGGNLKHILFNNGAHDSVGGQPTEAASEAFDFQQIALGCGYKKAICARTPEEIRAGFKEICAVTDGATLLEVMIDHGGHRKNLGRPTRTPIQNRDDFMRFLDRV